MREVELRLVPLWVQRVLEASGRPVSDALDEKIISSILSPDDLDFYYRSQKVLLTPFFYDIVCGSFSNFSGDKTQVKPELLPNDEISDLLYGYIPMGIVRAVNPSYQTQVYGPTDTIIVSVVPGDSEQVFSKHMFMRGLIKQLIGLRSFEHVANLPIFKKWADGLE